METVAKHFQLTYNLAFVDVEKTVQDERDVYTVRFSNEVPPVTLTAIELSNGSYYWDTVPPGNVELACSIGGMIEKYFKDHPVWNEEEY